MPKLSRDQWTSKSKCSTYERDAARKSGLEKIKPISNQTFKRQDKNMCRVHAIYQLLSVQSLLLVAHFWLLLFVDVYFMLKFFHPPSITSRQKRERGRKDEKGKTDATEAEPTNLRQKREERQEKRKRETVGIRNLGTRGPKDQPMNTERQQHNQSNDTSMRLTAILPSSLHAHIHARNTRHTTRQE